MVRSVRSKWEVGVFKCEICGRVFYNRESLFSHLADVHRTCCFICKWIFESKPDLIIHNLVSHDTSFYICGRENCLLQFKSEDELGAHLEEKHVNFVKQKQSCELCGVKFTKAMSPLKHKINDHKVGNVYICLQCQFCSDSVDGLMEHERREQGHNHPPLTLPSTKPHIILDGKPIIPCEKCKTKFRLGTDLIQHLRLKHRDVINNKGAGEWKCGECKKEFKQEISLNHHFIAKHKPRKEDDKLEVIKEGASLQFKIKIEIKSEPRDQNEYYENLFEMTDLKTEAIYKEEIEPDLSLEETLEEPVYHFADNDYSIKQEDSPVEEADYNIKVEESDEDQIEKETSEVIFNQMSNNEVKEVEVGQDRRSGMIRVYIPAKFNNMQDDFIKEFFEVSYGKIIKFARCRKVHRAQKKKGFKSFCWITFEDEKASKFLDKQGHVMLDGRKLKTVACKHSEEKETLRPPQSGQKSKHPLMAQLRAIQSLNTSQHQIILAPQVAAIPPRQVAARSPPQVVAIPLPQVADRPPPQVAARPPPQVTARPSRLVPARTPPQVAARPSRLVPARPPPQVAARPPPRVPARTPPQVPARPPPQVAARPPPQVPAGPPPQYPAIPSTSYYGYQNQPYGWPWGQAGHGYYPAQFGSVPWSGDRTQLWRPYCYYDATGKLVQRRGVNARMWPY